MRVSVVIPCHNGLADTRECLQSMFAQEDAPDLEVLLVDNGSTDDTPGLGREFPLRVLRQEHNKGFAGGVNCGLREADGDLVLILNNDTMAAPRMLTRLVTALSSDPRIGLVAPVSNHVKGPARISIGHAGASPEGRLRVQRSLEASCGGMIEDADTLAGLCLLLRRELLQQVGTFDERFGLGNYEDDDFCLRARLLGLRLVISRDSFLHHKGHRTFQALQIDYAAAVQERRALFEAKWRDDPAAAASFAALQGRLDEAATLAREGLLRYPAWPDGHWILARHAAAQRHPGEALQHVGVFLQHAPLHTMGHVLLAFQKLLAGDQEGGSRAFSFALEHCYFSTETAVDTLARYASFCLERGLLEEAEVHAATALSMKPDDAALHNLLGVIYMESGKAAEAQAELREAQRRGSHDALTNLGVLSWRQGQRQAALQAMAEALRRHPDDARARQNLERALAALKSAGVDVHGAEAALSRL